MACQNIEPVRLGGCAILWNIDKLNFFYFSCFFKKKKTQIDNFPYFNQIFFYF